MNVLEYIVINQKNIMGIFFISLFILIFYKLWRIKSPAELPKGIEATMGKYCFWAILVCSDLIQLGIDGIEATMYISSVASYVSLAIAVGFVITVFSSMVRIGTFRPGSLRQAKMVMLAFPLMRLTIIGATYAATRFFSSEVPFTIATIEKDPALLFFCYGVLTWPWALYFHFSKKARAVWG